MDAIETCPASQLETHCSWKSYGIHRRHFSVEKSVIMQSMIVDTCFPVNLLLTSSGVKIRSSVLGASIKVNFEGKTIAGKPNQ